MGKHYNVLIVGAGNIGAFFDTIHSDMVLTHAHAFSKLEGFNLLGFVDVDKSKTNKAAKLWNVKSFDSIEEVFQNNVVDVISVCVPDQYHYEIMKKISNFPVNLVFAEKPLAKNLKEAEKIIKLYNKKNIACLVNYSRRFVTQFEQIREQIALGEFGNLICGNGYYGKGILHNGSHLIDFLRYIIGEIKDVKTINYNYDFYKDDPSVSAILTFEKSRNFIIQNIPCSNYTIFEVDLLFEKKRVRIIDSGFKIEIYEIIDSKIFNGYKNLINTLAKDTSLGNALENAALNIYNHLQNNEKLKCTLEDGYRAMEICYSLKAGI